MPPRSHNIHRLSARRAHLSLERLEDRLAPHTGVALYSTGLTPDAGAAGIVQGPDNDRWFVEFAANKIGRIVTAGTATVIPGVNPAGTITEFNLPAGRGPLNITVGPDNNLWFTENTGDRIGRINPLAGSDAAIQASLTEFTVPNNGGTPSGPNYITTGPDGALWFTESTSDEIGRITTAGVVTNEFAVPGAGSAPSGIAAGADGKLWFTEAGSGEIGNITTGGTITEFTIPVPNAAAASDPEDIVLGPNGNLFFTDFGRDQIGRITPDGQFTQFQLPIGRGPNHIVAFNDGDLYFTESASSRIGRLPSSALVPGAPKTVAQTNESTSPGASTLVPLEEFDFVPRDSVPLGITISETGDIWFTLNNGNAIANFLAHLQQLTATATGPTIQEVDVHFNPVRAFTPFDGYQGQLSLSVTDTNRNGIPDVVVGVSSPGAPPAVKIFDGGDNRLLASFYAFDPSYLGGITLTSEDINGDGYTDVVVAAGAGASAHIKVIDGTKLGTIPTLFPPISLQPNNEIADSALLASFFAFDPSFTGGVSLASGDVNLDGKNDIIVGAGPGAPGGHVKIIDATKMNQVMANGEIADSALLASFFAFDAAFKGGIFVGVNKNVIRRDIIIGSGPGATPHVEVVDGTKLGQVMANGQIANGTLLTSFFAFGAGFTGGVRVAADDLNFDGLAELIVTAGPGAGPHVKVIDGAKQTEVTGDGQISDDAVLDSTFVGDPKFTGGVQVASDADHRDGTVFGPPGINQPGAQANSRVDINDMFLFQAPDNPANTVMSMDVSPFSSTGTPAQFEPGVLYDFKVVNRDLLNASDDLTFRVTFGAPDPANANKQDFTVRGLPAARFPGVGGVIVKNFTDQDAGVRGLGGSGTQALAAEEDDPFFFNSSAFSKLLNHPTAVAGASSGSSADNTAGLYPSGTSNNGAGDGLGPSSHPDYNGGNFFANANTLSIILELPSTALVAPGVDPQAASTALGFWGRTEVNGVQVDRMGRPAINTALIPPVPRGSSIASPMPDVRDAFNAGVPKEDRANFGAGMVSVLTTFYPAGRPNGSPSTAQAQAVANLLLPDILVYRPSSSAGFAGDLATVNGTTFLAGGRKLTDDIISTELSVLTDDDLPAALGGGPDQPAISTQNVADDNGLKITDGSVVGPGNPDAGKTRSIAFPFYAPANANPANVPTGNPPV